MWRYLEAIMETPIWRASPFWLFFCLFMVWLAKGAKRERIAAIRSRLDRHVRAVTSGPPYQPTHRPRASGDAGSEASSPSQSR